jgi:DNA repair exonuclease SbcCD nuclease subunit
MRPRSSLSMTVRLLHSADLHLDAPLRATALADPDLFDLVETATREALDRLVAHCRRREIRALLLAGDVFDGAVRSVRAAAFFISRMQALREAGVQVYMIRGNHDAENDAPWRLDMPPNVHEFGPKGGVHALPGLGEGVAIRVHGVSYGERSAPDSLLPRFAPPGPDGLDIGLLHTSLSGAAGHGAYAPCGVGELVAHGYAYWALGHVHSRTVHAQGESWVVMPGAPQGRHINETGPKSATEITLRDGAVSGLREAPTAAVVFEHVDVACDDVAPGDLPALCRRAVERRAEAALSDGQAMVVRIRLVGAAETLRPLRFHADLRRQTIGEQIRALETCWLEDVTFAPVAAAGAAPETGVLAEIIGAMRALSGRPGMRRALAETLRRHLEPLPAQLRERVAPDEAAFEALLDALVDEGVEEVAAALEQAGNGQP